MGDRGKDRPTGFGGVLRELRDRAGLTQGQLADRAGMNLWGVAKLEAGAREPAWRTVLDLAAALGVPVTAFVPKEDTPASPAPGAAKSSPAPAGRPRGKGK